MGQDSEFPYIFSLSFIPASEEGKPCSYAALTLGSEPAPVLVAFVEAVGGVGIASRIAVSLSMKSFIEAAQEAADELNKTPKEILQTAFKAANTALSDYAESMRTSGSVAARGFGAVYDGEQLCVARVGEFNAFLIRAQSISNFFEARKEETLLEGVLGIHPKVLVDTASIRPHDSDLVVLSSLPLDAQWSQAKNLEKQGALRSLTETIATKGQKLSKESNSFVAAYQIGEPIIELAEVVID